MHNEGLKTDYEMPTVCSCYIITLHSLTKPAKGSQKVPKALWILSTRNVCSYCDVTKIVLQGHGMIMFCQTLPLQYHSYVPV